MDTAIVQVTVSAMKVGMAHFAINVYLLMDAVSVHACIIKIECFLSKLLLEATVAVLVSVCVRVDTLESTVRVVCWFKRLVVHLMLLTLDCMVCA